MTILQAVSAARAANQWAQYQRANGNTEGYYNEKYYRDSLMRKAWQLRAKEYRQGLRQVATLALELAI